ncbi:MAG: histidinol-phosphate aminotransferase family protein [SAR202 cluster bacterium]|nr:histidinol-phosphate aminotransferase family protein [SAR202 cluster bacterium]
MQTNELSRLSSLYGGYWNKNVLDFCYMTNRYFPQQRMIEDMQARLPELIGNYPSTNWYLSSLLAEQIGLTQNELVIGNGASELINAVVSRYVHRLAVPMPTFEEFVNRAKILGREVCPFTPSQGFDLDIDAFIEHVRNTGSDSALLIRPNNPTGSYLSKSDLVYFLDRMKTLNLVLVDESFLDFVDAEPNPSALDLINEYPNLLVLKSLSKNCGIPGIRLGYAATGNAERLADLRKDLPIWSINSFAQYFLEEMGEYRTEYTESCRQVREATQKLARGLQQVPFLEPFPTQGNFILCRILNGITGEELTAHLFEDCRVLVNNCGAKEGLEGNYIRIACRTEEDNTRLVEAFMRLEKFTEPGKFDAAEVR